MMMFVLKAAMFYLFGWLMLLGSSDLSNLPYPSSYMPIDSIEATDDSNHNPLFLDAVFEIHHSSTQQTPAGKTFAYLDKVYKNASAPSSYSLSYYAIGQQIVVKFTIKRIIFPFHCFT